MMSALEVWCRLREKSCFLVKRHHRARLPPLPHHWHAAQGIRCEISFVHRPEEQVAQDFEIAIHRRLGERLFFFVAILSVVARRSLRDLADGDIREIRQEDFQAVNVVGFRTGFGKEACSESAEGEVRLEPVRKGSRESKLFLILFVNSECERVCSPVLGRFRMPDAIDPDVGPIHVAALVERHLEFTSFLGEFLAVRESSA